MPTIRLPLPIANIAINVLFTDTCVTEVEYVVLTQEKKNAAVKLGKLSIDETKMAASISHELAAYWKNPHHLCKLPLRPVGTKFQLRVWRAMQNIPVGETLAYGDVAKILNSSPRAVGGACGANRIPLFIPCHRIIGKKHLGGFSHQRGGIMLLLKQELLAHEGFQLAPPPR